MRFSNRVPIYLLGQMSLFWHPWCYYQCAGIGFACNNPRAQRGLLGTSSPHRIAIQALFDASAKDLDATYRPGKTESSI